MTFVKNISSEQKTLLSLLGHGLFSAPLTIEPDVDWVGVAREARAQAVFSVAFNNYKSLPLSDELSARVKATLMKYALSASACFKNHSYLHGLMEKNGIPYCVVKGAASASYYPDPILRAMGDVDFYVHPDEIDRAVKIFEGEGFERADMNHPSHIVLRNGAKHFEMHFKPVGYHDGWIGEMLLEYWKDILETSRMYQGELAEFRGPSVFHHGFIMLTHLQKHLVSEGVGLRHFCDWALFASSLSNEEFVETFESPLKRIGLFRLAQVLSLGAVKYLGMEYRAWMGDDYDTAEELLADIIYGGNFGRKDKQRVYEGLFIVERGTGDVKKGRIRMIFGSLNYIVDNHWRAAKKFPLLYPIGWVFFSMRYLIRVALGKRQMNLVDTYKKSGERKEKYSKLKAFEPEE